MDSFNKIVKFTERLAKIGIDVELAVNYPWVYLTKVNGRSVKERFYANHGFTAFMVPVRIGQQAAIPDLKYLFVKIRQMVEGQEDIPEDNEYINYN